MSPGTADRDSFEAGRVFYNGHVRAISLQTGIGQAIAHHGELLQGVFQGRDRRLHRALLTLPHPLRMTTATFWPSSSGVIAVRPADRTKAARAAKLTLDHLGFGPAAGDLTIESTIPVGHGYGSSTADVIASIRAAAASAGTSLRPSAVSRLAIEAETASDAIAYCEQPVLFSHREGFVLEHFGAEYPPLVVVGCRCGTEPVDTLRLPRARYSSEEIEQFRTLRGLAGRAFAQQDPWLLGRIATISACISQRYLPKPGFDAVRSIAEDFGACGVQVSHSGTVAGILLDARNREAASRALSVADALLRSGFHDVTRFSINGEGALAG
jgi:uncharacterized protein involved in propanediol utilization